MEEFQSQIEEYSLVKQLTPGLRQEKYKMSLIHLVVLQNQSVLKNDRSGASFKGDLFPRAKSEIIRIPKTVMMVID